jgi:hypothetical protein
MPQLTFVIAAIVFLIAAIFAHMYFKKYPTDKLRVTLDSDEDVLPKEKEDEEEEERMETDSLLPSCQSSVIEDGVDVDLESVTKAESGLD